MNNHEISLRSLWVAIIMLAALTGAIVSTAVFWSTGTQLSGALGAGGVTFLGLATLGLAVQRFLND